MDEINYLANNSSILAFNSAPLKSLATIVPLASKINVAGIDFTLYWVAIGSFQNFRLETWFQVKPSFWIASDHLAASLSKDTPIMFKPLAWNSLYKATTLGFSALHGPHHEAQKSMIVTFPNDSFKVIILPSGFLAENSGALLPILTDVKDFISFEIFFPLGVECKDLSSLLKYVLT